MLVRKTRWIWPLLALGILFVVAISLAVGRYALSLNAVAGAIFNSQQNEIASNIVLSVRLPRILLSLMVGAGLAISGACFQGVFQNPLVSPDVLSVSSGAAFGAVLGIMTANNSMINTLFALAFGVISVFITYSMAKIRGQVTALSLVLSGIIISAFFNALISVMKYVADTETQLPAITYWLLGSFASTTYQHIWTIVFPVFTGCAVLLVMGYKINILSLGDEEAQTLGINPMRARIIVIMAATLITASCVTVTGIVGWVGLVIPHIARMLMGPNHVRLLPTSMLIGAIFMAVVDLIARTVSPSEIPVGILTALIGAPFFAVLFRRTQGE